MLSSSVASYAEVAAAASSVDTGDNQFVHSLPPFASSYNKELGKKIKLLETKLNGLVATAEDNIGRCESISAHTKNVQQELGHTQALCDAKGRQIETEEHLKQLADREAGRLALEIKRIGGEISDITDHLNTLQNNIYRGNERLEGIRTELKLENEELAEWLRVQEEKEEDNLALIKYSKEDEAKIKELSLSIEKFMQEVNKKKAVLSAEVTETQISQIELDKTTEAFKKLHQERQDLIIQWEAAIANMKKRDQDIINSQDAYQKQKEEIRATQGSIKEREEFLNQQLQQNGELEKGIKICERNVSKYREQQSEAVSGLQQYRDEVEVLRNTLNKSATELVGKKSELNNLKGVLQERQNLLIKDQKAHEDLKQKLYQLDDETMTLEAKANELQEIYRREEVKDKDLDRQIKVLREAQFKKSQELFKLRQEEKNLSAEILGGEAALKNLKTKIHKVDQEALKQRTMLYTMEFQIQQLERKLRRAQGDRSDEEKEELLKRIEQLNKEIESQSSKWALLNSQLKRSQEDLRHAKRQLDGLAKTRESTIAGIDELNLYNESASHQLSAKIKEKEELMVEENILRLELRKLRGFLNSRADEVFSLESRQVQLQLALEERAKEIDLHKDMLRIQIKNAEEERHSAAAELRERVGKVEKMKKRYEILMTQFAPEDGEEDHTQAYYVIKAAQRREELQREGDELDANIRRAEKEIKALENTLKMMNDRNESYRNNLYKAELDSKDIQHKEMLETEYRQVMENYRSRREQIQDLQQEIQQMEHNLAQASNEEANKHQAVQILEAKLQALERDILDKQTKRDRATKLIETAARQLRSKQGLPSNEVTFEEQDFTLRKIREVGTAVLTELNRIGLRFPEFGSLLKDMMQGYGVIPPSRQLSRVSSRASSVLGSTSGSIVDNRGEDNASEAGSQRGSVRGSRSRIAAGPSGSLSGMPPLPRPIGGSRDNMLNSGPGVSSNDQSSQAGSSRSESNPPSRKISTTNLNDMSGLPPAPDSNNRQGSLGSVKDATTPSTTSSKSSSQRGPITGSNRIKQPARPGSASSLGSRGSKGSGH